MAKYQILNTKYFYIYSFIGLFVYLYICLLPAFAQVSVTPSIIRLDLATDQPEADVFYKNYFKDPIELSFSASDFKALEDNYSFSFLDTKSDQNYHYGLSSWIKFSDQNMILAPGEKRKIKIFIQKDKLSPGAHYATIQAQINSQPSKKQVTIREVLSSLLFVRTNTGHEYESATLPTFETVRNFFDFPQTFSFRFNNTGDVDLTPYGLVKVYNGSTLITQGIVNDSSAPTLPESIRRYYVTMRDPHAFLLPGIYSANISLQFGKTDQKLTKTITFFSQGSIPFIPTLLSIALTFFVILFLKRKH